VLQEWVAQLVAGDKDDYENIAVKLGLDAGYRQAIRNRVWERRINSPLFNVRIYAKVSGDDFSFGAG
jgi:protein O-GlcNAc transferase